MSKTYTSPHPTPVTIGVIGGSGVYKLRCLSNPIYYEIDTPFGKPSGPICIAEVKASTVNHNNNNNNNNNNKNNKSLEDEEEAFVCAFLPRHGTHHSLNPSEVNYRANICAMKMLGVEFLLAINAVGSLHADYKPGDLVLVDQLIDKTVRRESTFFSGIGVVAHADFAFPTSQVFSRLAFSALCETFPSARRSAGENYKALGISIDDWAMHERQAQPVINSEKNNNNNNNNNNEKNKEQNSEKDEKNMHKNAKISADEPVVDQNFTIHASGTLIVMEGPQFSTRAESLRNKNALGGHLIGMTSCPEAKLSREAEIVYAAVAMVTDTDAWEHTTPHVDVAAVMKVVKANGEKAQQYPPAILATLARALKHEKKIEKIEKKEEKIEKIGKKEEENEEKRRREREALLQDPAREAMRYAVMGDPAQFSHEAKIKLAPLLAAKYPAFRP